MSSAGQMRAVEYDRYGGSEVLQVRQVPVPVAGRGEVLVRVRAAALNPKDVLVRKGKYRLFSGRRFPQRVGYDWAGEVLEAGPGSRYEVGQRLYGMINSWSAGAAAEVAAVSEEECAPMPLELTYEQAAALPLVSLTALQALRDHGRVQPGMSVLVNGASGGVGTVAIQIATALGADVTTLSSAENLELCRSLGAEDALDYRHARPLQQRGEFGCIFDVFGNLPFAEARPALASRGTYVSTIPSLRVAVDIVRAVLSSKRARVVVVRSRRADLEQLSAWVRSGQLKPVVDRALPLEQVREAEDYLATKRARGKVVLTVS